MKRETAMEARRLISPVVRRMELEEFELPDLTDDSILVQNEYTAVSPGTEIYNWLHGSEPGQPEQFPHTTGYCSTGVALEVGRKVKSIKPGDRVSAQGIHASHEVLTENVYPAPEGVASEDAAFLVMAAIALRGIRKSRVELGETVVVLGLGLVGQLAMSLARRCGAMPVIALDLDPRRLAKAKERGADVAINPSEVADLAERVRNECPADGADVVIEATGKPAVYPQAVRLARTCGRVIALGSPRGTVEMDFLHDVHLREVDLIGAFQPLTPDGAHAYYPWTKDRDRQTLLEMMAHGRLSVADLITHRFKPEECQDAYDMLADRPMEALGVLFKWT